ncbi:MAG: amino acid ABC transporter permease [Deltaproteobacteria bacterium]|jgi:polar amino acid transport system permease protein|nr:amino acid ABC transporter permease [Deltaproteobacteria bacterium]
MNLEFIWSALPLYASALILTVRIALVVIVLSLALGLVCSLILYQQGGKSGEKSGKSGEKIGEKSGKARWLRVLAKLVRGYIELARNTPLLIQLFFLYYALPKLGLMLSNEECAIIGLAFLGGGYMAESFRSGLEGVGRVQLEQGLSLGLRPLQLIRFVIFPQAIALAIPALGANCIFLIKETSVVSIIALRDLMSVTKELIGMYYNTVESLFLLVICYLLVLIPVSFLLIFIERKTRYAEFGV